MICSWLCIIAAFSSHISSTTLPSGIIKRACECTRALVTAAVDGTAIGILPKHHTRHALQLSFSHSVDTTGTSSVPQLNHPSLGGAGVSRMGELIQQLMMFVKVANVDING